MELRSSVTAAWKFCIIVSLLGCLLLLFPLNQNHEIITLWGAKTTTAMQEVQVVPKLSNYSSTHPPSNSSSLAMTLKPSNYSNTSPQPRASMVGGIQKSKKASVSYELGNRRRKVGKKCNMYEGRWVYKPESNPSYRVTQCPFIEEKMGCQRNGRPDFEYEKWSWEPRDCNIPLLNGTDMVERFRNKRVVLVGDSLNRNMWESLACILYSSIPNPSPKTDIRHDGKVIKTVFMAKEDYNFTVEFYWSPFLVELNNAHESGKKVLILDKLSPNSKLWTGADIMIFNSAHWWPQIGKKKAWELLEYKGKLIKDMPLHLAYKRAMKTWANWVQKNVNPKKTSVFFRSVSAEHLDKQRDQWCYTKTKPIMDESYKPFFPKALIRAIEKVIRGMNKSQVKYLDITKLSEYRIDAHPSIYRYKDWKIRAEKSFNNLTSTADCGHWCLPGLPDTWNRLFYASLLIDTSGVVSTS